MEHRLAELNIARLKRPLDADESAEFVAALDPINVIAENTPGFVWRLTDGGGQPSSFVRVPEINDPLIIVNYSIWSDLESFKHYVYKSGHASYLRRKNDWFEPMTQPAVVCWWTPADSVPDVGDAYARLEHLRTHGPTEQGWPPNKPFAPPERISTGPVPSPGGANTQRPPRPPKAARITPISSRPRSVKRPDRATHPA